MGKAGLSPRCQGHPGGSPNRDESPHGTYILQCPGSTSAPAAAMVPSTKWEYQGRWAQLDAQLPSAQVSSPLCSPTCHGCRVLPDTVSLRWGRTSGVPSSPRWEGARFTARFRLRAGGALSIPEDRPSARFSRHPCPSPCLLPRRLRRTSRQEQGEALAAALADTLWAAGGGGRATISLLAPALHLMPSGAYKPDNFTERVSMKTSSANWIFFKDTFGLKFLKTRNVKSHKPVP